MYTSAHYSLGAVPASYGRQKDFRPPPSGHPVFRSHSYTLHAVFSFKQFEKTTKS
ncbi:hypothetical protein GHT06_009629 [Daphnia sinensis]|uniref:Uncharacterized protein n=1 Tax=Daphnia sinensis TaxID=1820382 RepID=A0AAD5LXB5_9CRUS|nr:hypothetical protein GHT06_009629 [Daphnia sinensis]